MTKMIWNLDYTIAVPLNIINHFEIFKDANGNSYNVLAYYPGNTGFFKAFTADNKRSCIDYIESFNG